MSQTHNCNVLIIILCSLYDRLALNMLHFTVFLLFLRDSNHISSNSKAKPPSQLKEIIHYLSALTYQPNFLIGMKTADTDMEADISCIP